MRGGSGTRAVGLELTRWEREASDRARERMMEVGHERSGSNCHGGGGRRALRLEGTRLR